MTFTARNKFVALPVITLTDCACSCLSCGYAPARPLTPTEPGPALGGALTEQPSSHDDDIAALRKQVEDGRRERAELRRTLGQMSECLRQIREQFTRLADRNAAQEAELAEHRVSTVEAAEIIYGAGQDAGRRRLGLPCGSDTSRKQGHLHGLPTVIAILGLVAAVVTVPAGHLLAAGPGAHLHGPRRPSPASPATGPSRQPAGRLMAVTGPGGSHPGSGRKAQPGRPGSSRHRGHRVHNPPRPHVMHPVVTPAAEKRKAPHKPAGRKPRKPARGPVSPPRRPAAHGHAGKSHPPVQHTVTPGKASPVRGGQAHAPARVRPGRPSHPRQITKPRPRGPQAARPGSGPPGRHGAAAAHAPPVTPRGAARPHRGAVPPQPHAHRPR